MMIEVSSKRDLETQLRKNEKVLVLFYSSWCPFCNSFLPVFLNLSLKEDISALLGVKIDDYDDPLWEEYSIEAVPTVILFDQGKLRGRLDGRSGYGLSEPQFKEWLKKE
jgi:thioredoxin 1